MSVSCLFFVARLPPSSALFPYTTLFRSLLGESARLRKQTRTPLALNESVTTPEVALQILQLNAADVLLPDTHQCGGIAVVRSEEHTSELQSHSDLVCRLLLEKKNKSTR